MGATDVGLDGGDRATIRRGYMVSRHHVGFKEGAPLPNWHVKALEEHKVFKVIRRRWVVERSFAWYSFHRRLVLDYEFLPESTEAFMQVAANRMLTRRLAA
jgi:transposase